MQFGSAQTQEARHRPAYRPQKRHPLTLGSSFAIGSLVMGCLAPKYSVEGGSTSVDNSPDTSIAGAAGAVVTAGTSGPALNLRYCAPPNVPSSDGKNAEDWSCVSSTPNGAADTPGVMVSGVFLALSSATVFDRLDYCRISLVTCTDTVSPLPSFAFNSTQDGCAIINWRESGVAYSATMWHTITHAPALSIGLVPLLNPTQVRNLADALSRPITTNTAAIIGIKDCAGNTASGVRFAARGVDKQLAGYHFSIQQEFSIPSPDPTGRTGIGGLADLPPGGLTIYGYVGDGCIVAEASIISERSRIAYVYLVPNGLTTSS